MCVSKAIDCIHRTGRMQNIHAKIRHYNHEMNLAFSLEHVQSSAFQNSSALLSVFLITRIKLLIMST